MVYTPNKNTPSAAHFSKKTHGFVGETPSFYRLSGGGDMKPPAPQPDFALLRDDDVKLAW